MTREEAIRCLSVHSSTNGSGLCTDEQHYKAKQMAIEALEQTKWIPVSERLPEDNQEVQITYKINAKHHVWSAIWDEFHGRFYDKEYRSYISLDYVTAWKPSPEPYKGE